VKRFILSPEAERDLDVIKDHLLREASPKVARHVLRELRSAIRFLAANPRAGHLRSDLTVKPVYFWTVFSYAIVYSVGRQTPLQVVRVFHGARDVARLLE